MGNRSSLLDTTITTDPDKFFRAVAPYYDGLGQLKYSPEGYRTLNNEQNLQASLISMNKPETYLCPLKIMNDMIFLDIDEWKIQGYWYKELCNMFEIFQSLGLRGTLELEEEEGQLYFIRFEDTGVTVKIHGLPEWEEPPMDASDDWWDDREPLVYSKDQPFEIYTIKNGGLR